MPLRGTRSSSPLSVAHDADGRERFIASFERPLAQEVIHPQFVYRGVSYRRLLEPQARLLEQHERSQCAPCEEN